MTNLAVSFVLSLVAVDGIAADASTRGFWSEREAQPLPASAPPAAHFRPLRLDSAAVRHYLQRARAGGAPFELELPAPEGSFIDFTLADSQTLPPALAAKYPAIVSLAGSDGHGRKARVDLFGGTVQAMVFDADGVWLVHPEANGGDDRYLSFRRSELNAATPAFQCGVHDAPDRAGQGLLGAMSPATQTGTVERVFRAAVAANHNYVQAVCAGNVSVECGLAAVVQAMNRVNQVYETELAVHMTLVNANDAVIYPLADGDPYANDLGAYTQNSSVLNAVIGEDNYDIGHVFTTGSGGIARAGTCTSWKAAGTTGLPNPIGELFYVDYVAHEMGHQFGAYHTFNSQTGACHGGRMQSDAYEPGSASTIMSYAGLCDVNDLQTHSDPYFHARSLAEINDWIGGDGGACAVATPSTNTAPVIDTGSLPSGHTIPRQTPFLLAASATDADGDPLSYVWEEYDLGAATDLAQGDIGAGPIFRSFSATASGMRSFPSIESVLGAPLVKGEAWATHTRDLNFRLTVRDNHAVPGTPQFGATQSADLNVHVDATTGPFAIGRPTTRLTWGIGEEHTVAWVVAGTNAAPVNCAQVDLNLSADGGITWPSTLASRAPNTGRALVTVPPMSPTTQARVRVRCSDNIFFDVSKTDFDIAAQGDADPALSSAVVEPGSLAFATDTDHAIATKTLLVANSGPADSTLHYAFSISSDGCSTAGSIGWLAAEPSSGALDGGDSDIVNVHVDAAGFSPGTRLATLCATTDDPSNPLVKVAISLTVAQSDPDRIFSDGFDG